jgi:hypothetical protein
MAMANSCPSPISRSFSARRLGNPVSSSRNAIRRESCRTPISNNRAAQDVDNAKPSGCATFSLAKANATSAPAIAASTGASCFRVRTPTTSRLSTVTAMAPCGTGDGLSQVKSTTGAATHSAKLVTPASTSQKVKANAVAMISSPRSPKTLNRPRSDSRLNSARFAGTNTHIAANAVRAGTSSIPGASSERYAT